jgi:hypothetical protein
MPERRFPPHGRSMIPAIHKGIGRDLASMRQCAAGEETRRAVGEHQGGVDYGWAAYRHGTRVAGIENGGRLERGE